MISYQVNGLRLHQGGLDWTLGKISLLKVY